jgi:hypothetical protein
MIVMNTFIYYANNKLGDSIESNTIDEHGRDILLIEHTLRDVVEFHGGDKTKGGISILRTVKTY